MSKQDENTKDTKETKTPNGGGESTIEVKTQQVEVPTVEPEEEGKETPPEPEAGSETAFINDALVETVARVIGKTLALITKIPEMDFDEVEIEQLKVLWSPIVPSFSPTTMAIVGTVVIAGGKIGIYMAKRPKKPTEQTAESDETKGTTQTLEKQLEDEWKK